MMTKKDYVMLAGLIDRVRLDFMREHTQLGFTLDRKFIVPLAHLLKADDPRFDYARFLRACGVVAESVLALNTTIARNYRRNAQIPDTISDDKIWEAIQEHEIMVYNPEDTLNMLRSVLGLEEIPGLVDD